MTTSFGNLLHEGVTATLRDRKGLAMFALPAALLLALAWTILDRIEVNATAVSVTVELGLAYIAYFWQRRYLVGPELKILQGEERREQQREINKLAGRFVARAAVYYITLTILALIISFPIFMPFLQEDDPQTVFVFIVIVLGVVGLLMLVSARFLLAFPACAAGNPHGLGRGMAAGQRPRAESGYGGRSVWAAHGALCGRLVPSPARGLPGQPARPSRFQHRYRGAAYRRHVHGPDQRRLSLPSAHNRGGCRGL